MANTIRTAVETDLDTLCDLYYEFHEFHAHHIPEYLRSLGKPTARERLDLRQRIKQIMEGSGSIILVADESGRVIGFAEIYLKNIDLVDRTLVPRAYAYLQSLSVTEECRSKGVGMRLLNAAETWANEQGAAELRLDIWDFTAGPAEFYQKAGYRTYRRSLVKRI